jgi:predicted Zn-dependent protease
MDGSVHVAPFHISRLHCRWRILRGDGLRSMNRPALAALILMALSAADANARKACVAEVQRANESLVKIHREWPLRATGDPVVLAVQAIAAKLAERANETGNRRWRVHVLRDSKLNAFSVGDGHMFLTEGMLRFVESEAELAAVLAHEFGHHVMGHFCTREKKRGFFGTLFGSPEESNGTRRQVGSLTALVDPEKEREADRAAVAILSRAGYDPHAALALARRMSSVPGSAHFQYGQRIEALQSLLANRPLHVGDTHDSAAFRQLKNALDQESASR